MSRNFKELLNARWANNQLVCVGLDSDLNKLPTCLNPTTSVLEAQLVFNMCIIDATHRYACAFKPNRAFYVALGKTGVRVLADTIAYIQAVSPDVPVILDAKVADIDNTNLGYTQEAFEILGADALTVHPYLGAEAMRPYLDMADKGIIVLVRTSNKGAGEFQDLVITQENGTTLPLYQHVATRVAEAWNYNGNCAVVAGATYPSELAEIRQIVGDMPILIPGVGAQGGDLEGSIRAGIGPNNWGMIINNSRGIIFASNGEDFAEAAGEMARQMNMQMITQKNVMTANAAVGQPKGEVRKCT